jgi:hypothetical protein
MLAGYKLVLDIHMLIVILATKRGGGGGGLWICGQSCCLNGLDDRLHIQLAHS